MTELADVHDSESWGLKTRGGSNPPARTIK